jgi:8-oxo-dGTP pyrophosphatase MutT (NUDIX family)
MSTVGDGIRELEEELGLSIRLTDLEKVGQSMKK